MSRLSMVSKIAAAGTALAAVGGGAYVFAGQNVSSPVSSFTSNSPSVSTVSTTPSTAKSPMGNRHHRRLPEHAVITYFGPKVGNVTLTEDSGTLSAISSGSVTIKHMDGTSVTVPISSTTHFGRISLTQLESEVSSTTPPRVLLIEKNGTVARVIDLEHKNGGRGAATTAPNSPQSSSTTL